MPTRELFFLSTFPILSHQLCSYSSLSPTREKTDCCCNREKRKGRGLGWGARMYDKWHSWMCSTYSASEKTEHSSFVHSSFRTPHGWRRKLYCFKVHLQLARISSGSGWPTRGKIHGQSQSVNFALAADLVFFCFAFSLLYFEERVRIRTERSGRNDNLKIWGGVRFPISEMRVKTFGGFFPLALSGWPKIAS